MTTKRKYRAFISYSHQDKRWGDWLHKALETYRVPRRLVGRNTARGPVSARIGPVFRDREELPSATELGDVINQALADSECLIVICSPRSAKSRWVNEEILTYKRLGRSDHILCLIVDGEPNAGDKPELGREECFPEALKYRLGPNGELTDERTEPVAADARPEGDGKQNAKLKLLAGVLGIGFDDLRQREQQRRQQRLAIVSAAALAGLALTTTLAVNAFRAQQEAERERDRAEVEARTAERTTDFLVSLFAVSDPGEARGNSITAREILDAGAARIENELADEPDVKIRLLHTIGAVYRALGLYSDAVQVLQTALDLALERYGPDDVRTAELQGMLAYAYNTDGSDLEASDRLSEAALETFRKAYGDRSPEVAMRINGLAFGWVKSGRNSERAVELLQEALTIQRGLLEPPHPDLAETLFHLGWATGQVGDREGARTLYEEALAMRRELYGDTHPSIGWSLNNLGHLEIQMGNPEKGKAYCEEALAINRRLFEGLHNEQGFNLRCIAMAERDMDRLEAALAASEESVRILRATLPAESLELANNIGVLADIQGELGHFDASLQLRRELVDRFRAAGPEARRRLGAALNNLAYQESMMGRDDAALALYAEAVDAQREVFGSRDRRLVIPLNNLAAVRMKTGDRAGAEAPIREAIDIAREVEYQPDWVIHMLDLNLGEVLTELGRFDEACGLTGSASEGLGAALGTDHYRAAIAENVHGYCLVLSGTDVAPGRELAERGLQSILASRPAGESRRIDALERMVAIAARMDDQDGVGRFTAMIEQERLAAARQ